MSNLLDSLRKDFRIVPLRETDVKRATPQLNDFRGLVAESAERYPEIEHWLSAKVLPEIGAKRHAFVGYDGDTPTVSAVLKRARRAKVCHLRVSSGLRDSNIGELFFAMMALQIRHVAEEVHFTLAESVWEEHKGFFRSFGFNEAEKASTQYRLFETELRCSTSFDGYWASVLEKLPKLVSLFTSSGYTMDPSILLAIRPRFAQKILEGKKTVEIRRRFSTKWIGGRASLYASMPVGGLVGEATIADVVRGRPDHIWNRFHNEAGCTQDEFENYTKDTADIYAVILSDVRPYASPLPKEQMSGLVGSTLTAPQSYRALSASDPWGQAISVAALLHGPLRHQNAPRGLLSR